jgi:hypothetical protein
MWIYISVFQFLRRREGWHWFFYLGVTRKRDSSSEGIFLPGITIS